MVTIGWRSGASTVVAVSEDTDAAHAHSLVLGGATQSWKGPIGRFDLPKTAPDTGGKSK